MELPRFLWTCALLISALNIAQAQTPFQNGLTWTNSTLSILPLCDYTSVTSGTVQCTSGVISIVSVSYGRQTDTPCPYTSRTCTSGLDVTSKAKLLCDGRVSCTFTRTNNNWTALNLTRSSVCNKVYYKELRLSYTCKAVNTAVSCGGLPTSTAPLNTTGWPSTCSGMTVGGMCVAPCKANYSSTSTRAAGVSSICTTNGTWGATDGECQPVQAIPTASPTPVSTCPGLPTKEPPANSDGWPSTCNNLQSDLICAAPCSTGYVGNYTSICLDGTWEPVDGSCTKPVVTCSGLPTFVPPANTAGWPAGCSGLSSGGTCKAQCVSGYTGGVNSTCTAAGTWSAVAGSCVQVTCPGLPIWTASSPAPSTFTAWPATCSGAAAGATCTAPCATGYTGNPFVSLCGSDGTWGPIQWRCDPVTCAGNPTATPPALSTDFVACDGLTAGHTCTAACAQGAVGTGYTATCQNTGTWSAVQGSCEARCNELPTATSPDNSQGWPTTCQGTAPGQSCAAACAQGSVGTGYTATCQNSGIWSAVQGSCEARCNELPTATSPDSSQGWPTTCQGTAPGQSCAAACAQGSVGTGYTATCQNSGIWSAVQGSCEARCNELPTATSPDSSQGWPTTCQGTAPGQSCAAACAQGSVGTGYTATCQNSGTWSAVQGSCEARCNTLPSTSTPEYSQGWPADCQGTAPGGNCTSACAAGYGGSDYRSACQSDGNWSPVQGYCAPLSCFGQPTASPPPNGLAWADSPSDLVAVSTIASAALASRSEDCSGVLGSTCLSLCKDGYSGNYTSTCSAGGGWSLVTGACVPAYCPGMPVAEAAGGTGWSSTCANAAIGAKCTQSCKAGYSGSASVECLANMTWSNTIAGACVQDTCASAPPEDLTGMARWPSTCAGMVLNGTCTSTCGAGYSGSGYSRVCSAKDTWSEPTGECIRDTCSTMPPYDTPANSIGWNASCVNVPTGSTCQAGCDSNFNTGYTVACIAKDTWGDVTGTCPEACTSPPTEEAPDDTRGWGPQCTTMGAVVGSRCVAGCAANFRGRLFSYCLAKNQWSEVTGTCEPICKAVHRGCETCRSIRIPGSRNATDLVCNRCFAGWRLRRDGEYKTCDCAPGFMLTGPSDDPDSTCVPCEEGKYCPGGSADENPESLPYSCPRGLETIIPGAKSEMQCYTKPGFGRNLKLVDNDARVTAFVCPIGTYNVGGNTAGCTKCGVGLTTTQTGASNNSFCVAPAGSYVDRGIAAKVCPKGTYTTAFNNLATCFSCPEGITTKAENSSSTTQCRLAKVGYHLVNATTAELCPAGWYQGREAEVYACDACPYGWITKDEGSDGQANCMAPPGYELKDGADWITECDIGYWKEGWNKNPCVPCGSGLTTAATGSVSKDACLIPAGWGIMSLEPLAAVMCVNNSYGVNTTRAVVSSSRCVLCAPNLFTTDSLSGIPATRGYTQEADCLLKPGWGMSPAGVAEVCHAGTYNEGYNRQRCTECGTGFTSIDAGAAGEEACVVQSGWALDMALRIPKPCDVGTYSTGGTADKPAGECTPCPAGLTTQKDESDSIDDCEVCTAGHGGLNCTLCAYNSYSTGVQQKGVDCLPCAPGTVSARGSSHNSQCVPEQVDSDRDYFPLSDESRWTDVSGSTSLECQFHCNSNTLCIMFRFTTDISAPKCQLLLEDPEGMQAIALKADADGTAYAIYKVPADLQVGVLVADHGTGLTPQECLKLCSVASQCELVSLDAAALPSSAGTCKMYASEYDTEWMGMYHIQGNKLRADMLLGE